MPKKSGSNMRVRVGSLAAVVLKVHECNLVIKGQKFDITDSESLGFGEYTGGVLDCDVDMQMYYDLGTNPWGTLAYTPTVPVGYPTPTTRTQPVGGLTYPVWAYYDGLSGPYWYFSSLYVETVDASMGVRKIIPFNLKGCSSGTFTVPAS